MCGVNADPRGSLGDVGVANAFGDVGSIEKDAAAGAIGFESNIGIAGETLQGTGVVEILIGHDGLEGKGAVHGAGFEVKETEVLREMTGYVLLPAPAGPSMAMIGPRFIRGALPDYDSCADLGRWVLICGICFSVCRDGWDARREGAGGRVYR